MFEPRHNIVSNVRADIRKYAVSWFEHSRESNRPVPGPLLAVLSIEIVLDSIELSVPGIGDFVERSK